MLATLPLKTLTELGFTIAFGVLLDTFVVRSVLVPALVFDVGGRVWWPSALARPRQAPHPRDAEIAAEPVPEIQGGEMAVENVWDYPRPPAVEPCRRQVRVEFAGQTLADSNGALRVLETSHPPTIYVPRDDVRVDLLVPSRRHSTYCEFKGTARYLDALISNRRYEAVAWTYPEPFPGYDALKGHFAFYPGRADAAWLDEERVLAQAGDFYGGWISAGLIGPFKGAPGTSRW